MKLCFSTLGCPDWSFEQILKAGQMGFDAVEIRGIGERLHPNEIECLLPENREMTKAKLREAGLSVAGFGSSVMLHRDTDLSEGFAAIDLCGDMGIPLMRVFGDAFPEGEDRETVYSRVAAGLNQLLKYAQDKGVSVVMETHGQFNTLETLSEIIDRVGGHPCFGFVWDIEHTFRGCGQDIEPLFQRIFPYVKHVHMKDARLTADGKTDWALPGEGEVDMKKHLRLLTESGYTGYYSFEWEKRWRPEIPEPEIAFPKYIEYMKKIGGAL